MFLVRQIGTHPVYHCIPPLLCQINHLSLSQLVYSARQKTDEFTCVCDNFQPLAGCRVCLLTCVASMIARRMPTSIKRHGAQHGPNAPHCCRHFCLRPAISHIGGGAQLGGGGNLWMGTSGVPMYWQCSHGTRVPGKCMGIIVGYSRVKLALPRT